MWVCEDTDIKSYTEDKLCDKENKLSEQSNKITFAGDFDLGFCFAITGVLMGDIDLEADEDDEDVDEDEEEEDVELALDPSST